MSQLIKLSADHYVIVDDSEIKEGDWCKLGETSLFNGGIGIVNKNVIEDNGKNGMIFKKITHSTQPLEYTTEDHLQWDKIKRLSISEVKELLGEVDAWNKSWNWFRENKYRSDFIAEPSSYEEGYNQALEDNKDRKYTEEDMRIAIRLATTSKYDHILEFYSEEEILKSIQPKTKWEVEFIDGKLKLK